MNQATKRSILRWIHIVFGIPIIGYIYSPFHELPTTLPLFVISPFPSLPFQDCGCGKAMPFDGCFEEITLIRWRMKRNRYESS